jgi:hypothetical protein
VLRRFISGGYPLCMLSDKQSFSFIAPNRPSSPPSGHFQVEFTQKPVGRCGSRPVGGEVRRPMLRGGGAVAGAEDGLGDSNAPVRPSHIARIGRVFPESGIPSARALGSGERFRSSACCSLRKINTASPALVESRKSTIFNADGVHGRDNSQRLLLSLAQPVPQSRCLSRAF